MRKAIKRMKEMRGVVHTLNKLQISRTQLSALRIYENVPKRRKALRRKLLKMLQ